MDPTRNGKSTHGARKSAVFGNSIRSLMLVLLATSHPAWLPVAWAQPVSSGAEYTTNNQLLPPVAMDSTGNFVVVWKSFGSAGRDTGKYNVGVREPALRHHEGGDPNNQAEPAVAIDGTRNLVVVWLSDGKLRIGHRSIALLHYAADTSPEREGGVGREIQETSARPPDARKFTKSHLPSASGWNGGSRLP